MRKQKTYLAIDLGASSGRVMAGRFDGKTLSLETVHRFPNGGTRLPDGWHWSLVGLFAEIKQGLAKSATQFGKAIISAGVDTWGVDYGLLDKQGRLLGLPYMYRDERTSGVPEKLHRRVAASSIYGTTGIQSMYFNSLYQLCAEKASKSAALEAADRLLFVPDLIHYWLSGVMANEYTIASTSRLLDAAKRNWARDLIKKAGLPGHLFKDLVAPGSVLGSIRPDTAEDLGLGKIRIVAPGSHDTASAVAAVPTTDPQPVYLSSGTWSLLGTELGAPLLTKAAAAANITNEGGVCDTIRLLKNITGLWLLQECRRNWNAKGADLSFAQIEAQARDAKPFSTMINPDDASFATPGDMPKRIAAFCRQTRQKAPTDEGSMARVIYESLALRYRAVWDLVEGLTGQQRDTLHIVGGGSRDSLLSQMTANALQRRVVAGPEEATAIGNILMQMLAAGDIATLAEGRDIVRRSFPVRTFEPRQADAWANAYARYQQRF